MIADDEAGIRALVRMTLESHEYEIIEASDGLQVLALVSAHRPTLVLLDVTMPGLSGLEVCRAIKADPDLMDTKVIMLTAKAQEADIIEGRSAGADDYITKPFSPTALMHKVEQIYRSGGGEG